MKRTSLLVLVAAAAFTIGITACGSEESSSSGDVGLLDGSGGGGDTGGEDGGGGDGGEDVGGEDTGVPECEENADCAGGELCVDGECRGACVDDDDCEGALRCDTDDNLCVECLEQTDCGDEQACVAGFCEDIATGCIENADCGGGEVCDIASGECVEIECQNDGDCADDEICQRVTFQCIPASDTCDSNGDCAGGEVCRDSMCVAIEACESGATECTDDGRLRVCGADGTWTTETCDEGICAEGECTTDGLVCEPNARFCEDNTAVRCNGDGTSTLEIDCLDEETCVDGRCIPPGGNLCGGDADLDADPGDDCGDCGVVECEGPNDVFCDDPGENACGGCGELDNEPNTACGTDACSFWVCDGDNDVTCEVVENACGGCGGLDGEPGEECGECGVFECAADGLLVCSGEGDNGCGGCEPLDGVPGEECGTCGVWECSFFGGVQCDESPSNACGGCGMLGSLPGSECTFDDGRTGLFACSDDGESLECIELDTDDCVSDTECREAAETLGFGDLESVFCDEEVGCFVIGDCSTDGDPSPGDPFASECRAGSTCEGFGFGLPPGCTCDPDGDDVCRDGEVCDQRFPMAPATCQPEGGGGGPGFP